MKRIAFILLAILINIPLKSYSQTTAVDLCNFSVSAVKEIKEKYHISQIGIRGVPLKIADKILNAMQIKRGDELYLNMDSLCIRLQMASVYKKYYLTSIEFYPDSLSDMKDGALVRFKFEKLKK